MSADPDGARGRVVVLGSVNVDLVVSVARLPGPGETVAGGAFGEHHGGKGANQAVAAARLGAKVTLVGAVGNDQLGAAARENLRAEGVDVEAVITLEGATTGVAVIVVDETGENQIAVASGANSAFDERIWESAPQIPPGGVLLTNFEVPDDAIVAGAMRAAEAGAQVVVNPAPARPLPGSLVATGLILVPNELEANALTGEVDPAAAARVLGARTGAPVIVTLGARGAILVQGGELEGIAAPLVEAVDTTGAGDAFAGALATELSRGRPILDAARFAVHAASLSVTAAGAREGMPSRADVESSLRGEQ